jgi:outer membrane lipoprotein-sorting protein
MKMRTPTVKILLACALLSFFSAACAQDKPNIVLADEL